MKGKKSDEPRKDFYDNNKLNLALNRTIKNLSQWRRQWLAQTRICADFHSKMPNSFCGNLECLRRRWVRAQSRLRTSLMALAADGGRDVEISTLPSCGVELRSTARYLSCVSLKPLLVSLFADKEAVPVGGDWCGPYHVHRAGTLRGRAHEQICPWLSLLCGRTSGEIQRGVSAHLRLAKQVCSYLMLTALNPTLSPPQKSSTVHAWGCWYVVVV